MPTVDSMVGLWTIPEPTDTYRDVKAEFRPDGTFRFKGGSWSSTGRFRVEGRSLCLTWTTIDGEEVEPGTVRKSYDIGDDNCTFYIDNYTYRKLRG